MKSHLWRPLWVVLVLVALLLVVRQFMVPADFGVHGENFTYGFYRQANVAEWREFPAKYRGSDYCNLCHTEQAALNRSSPHAPIQCENCHGPAIDHPQDPPRLAIDRGRGLCLRCHAALTTPDSGRRQIAAIESARHHPGRECVLCHNPHNPHQSSPEVSR
ncbi:cytochrome C [Desulfurivibrio sp. D14AmB]|uniref:cytochrome C n=1 Tax=Desulfurivibrio sp. D14AmB TaxID=3374370 RepID=UPI00376F2D1D